MAHPTGAGSEGDFRLGFDSRVRLEFRDNEVRLQLHALAYNLGSFLKRAELPEEVADWSLTSTQSRLKIMKLGNYRTKFERVSDFRKKEVWN